MPFLENSFIIIMVNIGISGITSVSSVWSRGAFVLIRQLADSGFSGLFGLNRSDPAAHAEHYAYLL